MISSKEKLANAVGGKSARACDNCARIRARWYCAADDAFLCQSCDSSVHCGNPMARRHERVCLKTTSIRSFYDKTKLTLHISKHSWHQGFTRKARTPRQKKKTILNPSNNALHFVPEIYVEENSNEEDEKQLLYMVPMFDPFSEEVSANAANSNDDGVNNIHLGREPEDECINPETSYLHGFLPTEMDLAEFADDVENLLGKGLEDESFDMEGLGIFDVDDKEWSGRMKVEDGKNGELAFHNRVDSDLMIDMERETSEINFEYDSPINYEEEAQDREQTIMMNSEKNMFLRLDYEGVLLAWDGKSSPWTTEERPDLNFDECWPDFMGACVTMHVHGDMGMRASVVDEGREARVSRYREKRLTRLFSKKIRYEVRKLNAEKRPRMKGRFVKRANPAGAFPLLK